MWLTLGFLSALMLGFYDLAKKQSLKNNAVLPVLFLNTLFCSLFFLPLVLGSALGGISVDSELFTPWNGFHSQGWILLKSFTVLASWVLGYYGIKNLPLTIVGPINATRPVLTLLGALIIFGERLNLWQWAGVLLALFSLYMLSRTGKKEGIDFRHNKSIICVILAALLGGYNSLYDKFLMASPEAGGVGLDRMEVQAWYNIYQCLWMFLFVAFLWWPKRREGTPFRWSYTILLISIFLTAADFAYLYALSSEGAMVSLVSMVRRSNVLVSFAAGVLVLGEKNWRHKALDLFLVLLGMIFIWIGTH